MFCINARQLYQNPRDTRKEQLQKLDSPVSCGERCKPFAVRTTTNRASWNWLQFLAIQLFYSFHNHLFALSVLYEYFICDNIFNRALHNIDNNMIAFDDNRRYNYKNTGRTKQHIEIINLELFHQNFIHSQLCNLTGFQ